MPVDWQGSLLIAVQFPLGNVQAQLVCGWGRLLFAPVGGLCRLDWLDAFRVYGLGFSCHWEMFVAARNELLLCQDQLCAELVSKS